MRTFRTITMLAAAFGLAAGLATTTASASPAADASVLAANGVDVASLAPGWTLHGDRVVWNDGAVVLSVQTHGLAACDSGYVCLYEADNYNDAPVDHNKRMLQFNNLGGRNMSSYGFNDRMSSWYNRRGLDAVWFYHDNQQPAGSGRCMQAGGRSARVGEPDNDELSSLWIYSTATAC
jgi:hypothetical protein